MLSVVGTVIAAVFWSIIIYIGATIVLFNQSLDLELRIVAGAIFIMPILALIIHLYTNSYYTRKNYEKLFTQDIDKYWVLFHMFNDNPDLYKITEEQFQQYCNAHPEYDCVKCYRRRFQPGRES